MASLSSCKTFRVIYNKLLTPSLIRSQKSTISQRKYIMRRRNNPIEVENSLETQLKKYKQTSSNTCIDESQNSLKDFLSKQWEYFNETYQSQAQDEKELMDLIQQTYQKRIFELKGLLQKEKYEATEGTSIVRVRNLLREKCGLLERQLSNIKEGSVRHKKQVIRQVKSMLKTLEQIEQGQRDRQSKQKLILSLIDRQEQ